MSPDTGIPSRIARYEILAPLGRGGMGEVYLARDPHLEREVALKVLTAEYASDVHRLKRFRREARIASGLNHPHICTIHDIGEEDGRPFIVMERVAGQTLGEIPATEHPVDRVLHVGAQIARALAAAHAAGVVHRDIKPGNVMVRDDGYAKVVDFGLAHPAEGTALDRSVDTTLTEPGAIVGTLRYMSPEQARGGDLDGASDVFSLGVVLYEMATGTHPFEADSRADLIQAILSRTPLSADRVDPQVPTSLASLLQRMLTTDAALRPSAAEVAAQLEAGARTVPAPAPVPSSGAGTRHTVGRRRELDALVEAFDEAASGRSLFLCVAGEPGIGKSTLMEAFLEQLRSTGHDAAVAWGRCSERLAGTEAYLPVLEALEGLVRGVGGDAAARTIKAVAPSWYAQLVPTAAEGSSLARALQEGGGVSQERLKRELGSLAAALSRPRPLVLLLDDIHWADASTVDLLAYLGTRVADQRVLTVLSYRPSDLALAEHSFGALKLDLQARGSCREITLGFLTLEDVERYVALEYPGNHFPPELGALIHARTEGSPLFMADLLRYLADHDVLVEEAGRWVLGRPLPELADRLPESVRSMVQRKVEQLSEDDRRLLVGASVQGYEFDAVVVAEALEMDPAAVEDRLDELDRIHNFVSEVEERELPDRTLTLRYRFVHVLYQNALYGTLRPVRRASLSRGIAEALLRHHGEDDTHIAAELALLLESARDPERATHFFLLAAQHAVRIFANREAAMLARRGLDVLEALHPSPERDRRELALLVTLGPPLKDTRGWSVPEVMEVYARANELGERIGATEDLFPALWGMWISYSSTADIPALEAMGRRLLEVAKASGESGLLLQAHHALTTTHYMAGDYEVALEHAEQGRSLYDPARHGDHAFLYGGHDPGSCCVGFSAHCLWMLGHADRSLERCREALGMAEKRGHPVSLALAHWNLGVLHQFRREPSAALEQARSCQRITLDQGAPIFPAVLQAWAEAERGNYESGLEQLRAALADPEKIPIWWQAYFHRLLAQVLARAGRNEEALASIRRSREVVGDRAIDSGVPDVYRLEGDILFASSPSRREAAERALRRAIELAREQEARMLELRATVSLGRLCAAEGRGAEIRPALSNLYGWFTEGFDTVDLREAKELLESLG